MKGELLRSVGNLLQRHGPSVLTFVGCAGVAATVAFAVDEIPKTKKDLEERTMIPTKLQTAKIIISKCPKTLISGIVTLGCIIGANAWNTRQKSNLIAGIAALGTAYKGLHDETVKVLGEEKVAEIEANIADQACVRNDISERPKKYSDRVLVWDTYLHRAYWIREKDFYYGMYQISLELNFYHNGLFKDLLRYFDAIDANTGKKVANMESYGNLGWNDEGFPLIEASDQYMPTNFIYLKLIPNENPETNHDYILDYGECLPYDTIETRY